MQQMNAKSNLRAGPQQNSASRHTLMSQSANQVRRGESNRAPAGRRSRTSDAGEGCRRRDLSICGWAPTRGATEGEGEGEERSDQDEVERESGASEGVSEGVSEGRTGQGGRAVHRGGAPRASVYVVPCDPIALGSWTEAFRWKTRSLCNVLDRRATTIDSSRLWYRKTRSVVAVWYSKRQTRSTSVSPSPPMWFQDRR